MTFTDLEKVAIIKAAELIANADHDEDFLEGLVAFTQASVWGIGEEDVDKYDEIENEMEYHEMVKILSKLDTKQKKYASGFWAAIVIADDEKEDSEIAVWEVLHTMCGFPQTDLEKAAKYWESQN